MVLAPARFFTVVVTAKCQTAEGTVPLPLGASTCQMLAFWASEQSHEVVPTCARTGKDSQEYRREYPRRMRILCTLPYPEEPI